MKPRSNQPFKTTDLLSLLALFGLVASISTMIISRAVNDNDHSLAMSEAQNLAFQLVNGGFTSPGESVQSIRGPASTGEDSLKAGLGIFPGHGKIGRDPWGNSFQYSVVRNDEGKVTHVVVWSMGPNSKADTSESAVKRDVLEYRESIGFQGDDFGYLQPVSQLSQLEAFAE